MKIGRIKVIFTFPQQIIEEHSGNTTFTNLPQEILAYVEWYAKLQSTAEKNHLMYKISKPSPQADGSLPGAIIPLSDISGGGQCRSHVTECHTHVMHVTLQTK